MTDAGKEPTGIRALGGGLSANLADTMYASYNGADSPLLRLDLSTSNPIGTVVGTMNGPAAQRFNAFAFSPFDSLNVYASATNGSLYTVDTTTAQVTLRGPTGLLVDALAFSPAACIKPCQKVLNMSWRSSTRGRFENRTTDSEVLLHYKLVSPQVMTGEKNKFPPLTLLFE